MLSIRSSSPLFRLDTAEKIHQKVSFIDGNTNGNSESGIFAMILDDTIGESVESAFSKIVVIFNLTSKTNFLPYINASEFKLHPIQSNGSDEAIKTSKTTDKGFVIPALSSAVFVVR